MNFVIAVIAVVLLRHYGSLPGLQRDQWFRNWVTAVSRQSWLARLPAGVLLASVLGPVLALAVVIAVVDNWLFGLVLVALNLTVLLYSFGRGDMPHRVEDYRQHLDRADLQGAYHDAAKFNTGYDEVEAEDWQHLHREALAAIPYRYFERYFPVIFWFIFLGAPGALLYRLTRLQLDLHLERGAERGGAHQLLWVLEWIPLRLLGIVFALVGNFGSAIRHWQGSLLADADSEEVLEGYIYGALDLAPVPGSDDMSLHRSAVEVADVTALFDRALIMWLGLAAIVALLA